MAPKGLEARITSAVSTSLREDPKDKKYYKLFFANYYQDLRKKNTRKQSRPSSSLQLADSLEA
jgi:hypothetical protein